MNMQKFIDVGIWEFYSFVGRIVLLMMKYCKVGVIMCVDSDVDEFVYYCVDGEVVEVMKSLLVMGVLLL